MGADSKRKAWRFSVPALDKDKDSSKLNEVQRTEFMNWLAMSGGGRDIQYVGPFFKIEDKYRSSKIKALSLEVRASEMRRSVMDITKKSIVQEWFLSLPYSVATILENLSRTRV